MDQRFSTPAQLKWLPKLMGFDYEIVYKKGCENVVADALSRLPNTGELLHINMVSLLADLYQKIKQGWERDNKLQKIINKLKHDGNSVKHYGWSTQQLLRKGKLVVGDDLQQGIDTAYLLLYVDDIVLTASSEGLLQQIIGSLH
ncbi:hypothetical protein Tco_0734915 [Tanacetum coccineum]